MVNNILSVLIAVIFLISSSGYVMYKSHCSCIGEDQTSVFIKPETCEDDFHTHHNHDDNNSEIACFAHECHECSDHTKDCGCETPEFFFFKLKDKAVDDEVKFVLAQTPLINVIAIDVLIDNSFDNGDIEDNNFYADPPPKISSSIDFLVAIQQLKIPSFA